jgi:tetratricopeptide (TPR) repeat protein
MEFRLLMVVASLCAGCSAEPGARPAAESQARPTAVTITSKSPEAIDHLKKGEALLDNLRTDEAEKEFARALQLDPDFVLARAFHGQSLPGADGVAELSKAAAAAGPLPESERVLVQGMDAERRADFAAAKGAYAKVIEIAPDDVRGHYYLGRRLLAEQRYGEAVEHLRKATALNRNAGGAQNMLGYAALRQGDADGAIAAFTEYARILPQEPNPQDSLGEGLLAAGRFKDAEAAFRKALELSPQFWNAHEGIAYTKFYAGDWAGGRDALQQAKAAATRPGDKIGLDHEMAAAAVAQRNYAEALRIEDASAKTPMATAVALAAGAVQRAAILIEAGRAREALPLLASAVQQAGSGQLPPAESRSLRRNALRTQVYAESRLGDAAAAAKTSAMLDQDAQAAQNDPDAQSAMHYGRGELAMAQKKAADALKHFAECAAEDQIARWRAMTAADMSGDKAAAASAREKLLKTYERDPLHLIIRSRIGAPPKATT